MRSQARLHQYATFFCYMANQKQHVLASASAHHFSKTCCVIQNSESQVAMQSKVSIQLMSIKVHLANLWIRIIKVTHAMLSCKHYALYLLFGVMLLLKVLTFQLYANP